MTDEQIKTDFPTCRTCKFLHTSYDEKVYCKIQDANFKDEWGRNDACHITKPDQFMCSEYVNKETEKRFVKWGSK